MTNKRQPYKIERDQIFSSDERKRIMDTCKARASEDEKAGRKNWIIRYMLVDLAFFSGLRVAEMAALKIGDIDLKASDPYIIVRDGKGGKKRSVFIDKELARHVKQFIKWKKNKGEPTDNDSPLFLGRKGHVPPITLQKSFKKAMEEAGLDHTKHGIHDCRHTYATYLLRDTGNNLAYVQQQLGHSNREMTYLYTHVLPELNGALANKIRRD